MSTSRSSKRRKSSLVHKPDGVLTPRVQAVGPEHFGIALVDVSKRRIQAQVCDFYGRILVPFDIYDQTKEGCRAFLQRLQRVQIDTPLRDLVVAIERTGEYHRPIQRAAVAAGHEVRIVHPLVTSHFRKTANPGEKTDLRRTHADVFADIKKRYDAWNAGVLPRPSPQSRAI